jgi:hypothetical protein
MLVGENCLRSGAFDTSVRTVSVDIAPVDASRIALNNSLHEVLVRFSFFERGSQYFQ